MLVEQTEEGNEEWTTINTEIRETLDTRHAKKKIKQKAQHRIKR